MITARNLTKGIFGFTGLTIKLCTIALTIALMAICFAMIVSIAVALYQLGGVLSLFISFPLCVMLAVGMGIVIESMIEDGFFKLCQ